jgi:F-type H+-transporting ATPase subunit b
MFDASFYVAMGFVLFVFLLGYLGVHRTLAKTLDRRSETIRADLNEAKRLREEAASVLASFTQKKKEAEAEAERIVAQAKADATLMANEAAQALQEFVRRREQQAQERITLAETQAKADVRAAAADAAIAIASSALRSQAQGAVGDSLIDMDIAQLKARLN